MDTFQPLRDVQGLLNEITPPLIQGTSHNPMNGFFLLLFCVELSQHRFPVLCQKYFHLQWSFFYHCLTLREFQNANLPCDDT